MPSSPDRRLGVTRREWLRRGAVGVGGLVLSPLIAACDLTGEPTPTSSPSANPAPTALAPRPTPVSLPSPTSVSPSATASATPTLGPTVTATATPQFSTATKLHADQALRVGTTEEPTTLDPSLVDEPAGAAVADQLFSTLLRYKPDLTVDLDLAESYSVSPDGKTYTFRLRAWQWSDGKPGTASDFVYSFQRLADPRTAAPVTVYVEAIEGGTALVGALGSVDQPKRPSDADLQKLRDALGVKAIDDRNLQIELVEPTPHFLTMLPQPCLAPLRQDVVEKFGDRWTQPANLVSNGPFVLDSRAPRQKLTLKRNPAYFGKAPTLARVDLLFQTEAASLAGYDRAEVDVVASVPAADRARVRQDARLGAEMSLGTRLATSYLAFATRKKPFDSSGVRQAFQLAVDTSTLVEQVLGGAARPAGSFIPPGMPGHDPSLGLKLDSARAARLLADAGYASGQGFPKVTLAYAATPTNKAVAERVQSDVKRNLGLDIVVDGWSPGTFLDRIAAETPSIALLRWVADYPHPNGWLRAVFHSTAAANYGRWSNAAFDRLVEQAAVEQDADRALGLYSQAQRLLVEDAAGLWLYYPAQVRLVKPWVKGYNSASNDPAPGSYFWDRIQIEAH